MKGITDWVSSGYKKNVWIKDRAVELRLKYDANPELIPEAQRRRITLYAKEQANREWEANEPTDKLSDEELRRRIASGK